MNFSNFMNIQDQNVILKNWSALVNAGHDIKDETLKTSTAIVL